MKTRLFNIFLALVMLVSLVGTAIPAAAATGGTRMTITPDGNPADWGTLIGVNDAGDATPRDIQTMFFTYDAANVYFRIDALVDNSYINICIDSDRNIATGYNTDTDSENFFNQTHGVGLDYIISVSPPIPSPPAPSPQPALARLGSLAGGSMLTPILIGTPWEVGFGTSSPNVIEVALPRTSIPDAFPWKIIFFGNIPNPPPNPPTTYDEAPNSGSYLFPRPIVFVTDRDGNLEIYKMLPDGTNQINLTNNASWDNMPMLSPRGDKIAFVSERDGDREIYTMNNDGTELSQLTNNTAQDTWPSWSPDGNMLTFTSGRDGNLEIYTMDASGGSLSRKTNNSAGDSQSTWSPDGTRLAFTSSRDGNPEIYVLDITESGTLTRLTNNNFTDGTPVWSPDNLKIAFTTNRDGNEEIYTVEVANPANQVNLTNNTAKDGGALWLSNGKIQFTSDRDGEPELFIMDADGSNQTQLTTNTAGDWIRGKFGPPAVVTNTATVLGETSARLSGNLASLGSVSGNPTPAFVSFEWGTSNAYGNTTSPEQAMAATGAFTFDLTVPAAGTYHYRAKARGDGPIAYGADVVFTTASPTPTITPNPASGLPGTNFNVSGTGFTSNIAGWVWLDTNGNNVMDEGESSAVADTTASGAFPNPSGDFKVTTLEVPAVAPGVYQLRADIPQGGPIEASTDFNVLAPPSPTKLAFTAAPQMIPAGRASAIITVQAQDASGNPTNVTALKLINLSSTSASGTFSAGADFTTTVTWVPMPAGTNTASFYYRDPFVGTPTITASAAGLTQITQQETIGLLIIPAQLPLPQTELNSDSDTVLLEHFNGSSSGEVHGSVQYVSSIANLNQALYLPQGSWIRYVPTGLNQLQTAGSIEFFIAPTAYNTGLLTLQWQNVDTQPQEGFVLWLSLNPEGRIHYGVWNAHGDPSLTGTNPIPLSTWTHIAIMWDGNGSKIYVNGQLDASTPAITWPSSPVYVYLGYWGIASPTYIDELRISKVARLNSAVTTPSKLAFITTPQNIEAGAASGVITVQAQDAVGNPANVTALKLVNLSSTSATGTFSASADFATPVTWVPMPANTTSVNFYYRDPTAGTPTITAAAAGLTQATQQETIVVPPPPQMVFQGNRAQEARYNVPYTDMPNVGQTTTQGFMARDATGPANPWYTTTHAYRRVTSPKPGTAPYSASTVSHAGFASLAGYGQGDLRYDFDNLLLNENNIQNITSEGQIPFTDPRLKQTDNLLYFLSQPNGNWSEKRTYLGGNFFLRDAAGNIVAQGTVNYATMILDYTSFQNFGWSELTVSPGSAFYTEMVNVFGTNMLKMDIGSLQSPIYEDNPDGIAFADRYAIYNFSGTVIPMTPSPAPISQAMFTANAQYSYNTAENTLDNSARDFRLDWQAMFLNQDPAQTITHVTLTADATNIGPITGSVPPVPPAGNIYTWQFDNVPPYNNTVPVSDPASARSGRLLEGTLFSRAPGFTSSRQVNQAVFTTAGTQTVTVNVTPGEQFNSLRVGVEQAGPGEDALATWSLTGPYAQLTPNPVVGQLYTYTFTVNVSPKAGPVTFLPIVNVTGTKDVQIDAAANVTFVDAVATDSSATPRTMVGTATTSQTITNFLTRGRDVNSVNFTRTSAVYNPPAAISNASFQANAQYSYSTSDSAVDNTAKDLRLDWRVMFRNEDSSHNPISHVTLTADASNVGPITSSNPSVTPSGNIYTWEFDNIPWTDSAAIGNDPAAPRWGQLNEGTLVNLTPSMTSSRQVNQEIFNTAGTQTVTVNVTPNEQFNMLRVAVEPAGTTEDTLAQWAVQGVAAQQQSNPTVGQLYSFIFTINVTPKAGPVRYIPSVSVSGTKDISTGSTPNTNTVSAQVADVLPTPRTFSGTATTSQTVQNFSYRGRENKIINYNRISAASTLETPPPFLFKWGAAGSGNGQFSRPYDVAVDSAGNVFIADFNNNRIQKFTASGGYLSQWGSAGTGDGQFNISASVAVDSSNNVYVADYGNNRIQKFTGSGVYLSQWGTSGSDNGQFQTPVGIAVDSSGNVYVADENNHRIQKFDSSGNFIAKWGTPGSGDGEFNHPAAVTVDASGNVYVADYYNHRIQKFTSSGTFLIQWGTHGSGDGQLSAPLGIDVDASGNVYVADCGNSRIQKFSSSGTLLTKWGTPGSGDGQFTGPVGIAVNAAGNVYVTEEGNNRVQVFGPPIEFTISQAMFTANAQYAYNTSDNAVDNSARDFRLDWAVMFLNQDPVQNITHITMTANASNIGPITGSQPQAAENNHVYIWEYDNVPPYNNTVPSTDPAAARSGRLLEGTIVNRTPGYTSSRQVSQDVFNTAGTQTVTVNVTPNEQFSSIRVGVEQAGPGEDALATWAVNGAYAQITPNPVLGQLYTYTFTVNVTPKTGPVRFIPVVSVSATRDAYTDSATNVTYIDAPTIDILVPARVMVGAAITSQTVQNFQARGRDVRVINYNRISTTPPAGAGADFVPGPLMNIGRIGHASVTLPDGRYIVFGGHGTNFTSLGTAEVWTPSAPSFTTLTMNFTHDVGTLAKLADGRYLIAGGAQNLGVAPGYNTAEIFNPTDNSFTPTGTMTYARTNNASTLLSSGKVLVAGGWYDANSSTYGDLYDPSTGTFTATGALNTQRALPMLLPTADGKAVVFGGCGTYGSPYHEQVELYDPATNSFSIIQSSLFNGDTGWYYVYNWSRPLGQLTDGRYLLMAFKPGASVTQYTLFTFDPATKQFAKVTTTPALPDSSTAYLYSPVVDLTQGKAYLLAVISGSIPQQLRLYTIDLTGWQLNNPAGSYPLPANYYLDSNLGLLADGRIFITGGSSANDITFNFNPIRNTLYATPGYTSGPTPISQAMFSTNAEYMYPTNDNAVGNVPLDFQLNWRAIFSNQDSAHQPLSHITLTADATNIGPITGSIPAVTPAGNIYTWEWDNVPFSDGTVPSSDPAASRSGRLNEGTIVNLTSGLTSSRQVSQEVFNTVGTQTVTVNVTPNEQFNTLRVAVEPAGPGTDAIAQWAVSGPTAQMTMNPVIGLLYTYTFTVNVTPKAGPVRFIPVVSVAGTKDISSATSNNVSTVSAQVADVLPTPRTFSGTATTSQTITSFLTRGREVKIINYNRISAPSNQIRIGWIMTNGDWNVNLPDGAVNLTAQITARTGYNTVIDTIPLASLDTIKQYHFLILTGHSAFSFTEGEREILLQYAQQGGLLFMDDCANAVDEQGFDASARAEMLTIFGVPLADLPAGHGVFSSYYNLPGTPPTDWNTEPLQGIVIGGITHAVYSDNDYTCGWVSGSTGCMENSFQMGTNLAMYALSRTFPVVYTAPASDITATGARLNGYLNSLGGLPNMNVSFEWGTSNTYGNTTSPAQTLNAPGAFFFNLGSLSTGVIYHYRTKAQANGITIYGNDMTFLPQETPPPFRLKYGGFNMPMDAAVDTEGNVYVADYYGQRIYKTNASGGFITQWGTAGSGDGEFSGPTSVAVDSSNNVYVAEAGNARVQKFNSSGSFLAKWGGYGVNDGELNTPYGIAVDASGNVYVADYSNHRIQKFNNSGGFLAKWGTNGTGDGEFNYPVAVATDASGNVYVADYYNHRIQKFNSSGNFITKWGTAGSGDGQFSLPRGIEVNAAGQVYVADYGNHRIQKFSSSGTLLTKWGTYGSGDGQFAGPAGVATNAAGNVYVVEAENNRVSVFGPPLPQPPAKDWTFMVYMSADNDLNDIGLIDLNEMEVAGSTDRVNVIAMLDLYGPDNTTVYYVEKEATPSNTIISTPIAGAPFGPGSAVPEANMGDPATLATFTTWTAQNYPANNYALIMWNHGTGWRAQALNPPPYKGVSFDNTNTSGNTDYLTTPELGMGMTPLRNLVQAPILLGFDACMMQMAEVAYQVHGLANIMVGSEEMVPVDGMPYDAILNSLIAEPTKTPLMLANDMVTSYLAAYASPPVNYVTMSSINLQSMSTLASAISTLSESIIVSGDRVSVTAARNQVEYYNDPAYIDLYDFADKMKTLSSDAGVQAAAEVLKTIITSTAVLNEGHGANHPNSHGISIFFPASSPVDPAYFNLMFSTATWDTFLTWYFTPLPPQWTEILADPQGDETPAGSPDIVGIDKGTPGTGQIAFQVRTFSPINYAANWGMTILDTDQNKSTGEPNTGGDYAIYVTGALGAGISGGSSGDSAPKIKFPPDMKYGEPYGMLTIWNPATSTYDWIANVTPYTGATSYWTLLTLAQLGNDDGNIDVLQMVGIFDASYNRIVSDRAPDAAQQPEDTVAPTVTLTEPANNATGIPVNQNVLITFSEIMKHIETQSAFSISPSVGGVYSWIANNLTYDPTTDLAANTTYTITIGTGAQDLAGNPLAEAYTFSFTTAGPPDVTAPTISTTVPADGTVNVPINTNISVTFSEAVDHASAEGSTSYTPPIDGTYSWSGNTMIFNPTSDLANGTVYSFTVCAQDLAGNPIAGPPYPTFSFTTEAALDLIPPTVTSTTPANNATGVAVNTNIDVTFSESVKHTETEAAFSINPSVAGIFSWSGNTMTFNPNADLGYSTNYSVTIGTGVLDISDNNMASPYTFSFTTAAPPVKPDLIITEKHEVWNAQAGKYQVFFTVKNAGAAGVTTPFNVGLKIDNTLQAEKVYINFAMAANATSNGSFTTIFGPVNGASDTIEVIADVDNQIDEADENNNSMVNTWNAQSDVLRFAPRYVVKNQTFDIIATFFPSQNLNAIGISDTAPTGWIVEVDDVDIDPAWCTPNPMVSNTPFPNNAQYVWSTLNQGTAVSVLYKVTVPADAAPGIYSFTGTLEYYIGQTGPNTINISGDSQVEVVEGARVEGSTWEAKGIILGGVTLTIDGTASVVSDTQGIYQLTATTTGTHTVVATKTGYRSQTRTVNVTDLGAVYTLDFKANNALVPNATDLTYVLACINKWKFPPEGLGLNLTKVLAIINAWKFPKNITLSPASGAAATVITVNGTNYPADTGGVVWFDSNGNYALDAGEPSAAVTTTSTGALPAGVTLTVPALSAGTYQVCADIPSGSPVETAKAFTLTQ